MKEWLPGEYFKAFREQTSLDKEQKELERLWEESEMVGSIWRTRNNNYVKIDHEVESKATFRFRGSVYSEEGKPLFNSWWDHKMNNIVTKDLDLVNRKMGDNPKGWPNL